MVSAARMWKQWAYLIFVRLVGASGTQLQYTKIALYDKLNARALKATVARLGYTLVSP